MSFFNAAPHWKQPLQSTAGFYLLSREDILKKYHLEFMVVQANHPKEWNAEKCKNISQWEKREKEIKHAEN